MLGKIKISIWGLVLIGGIFLISPGVFAKDIKIGGLAPNFNAIDDSGKGISLSDFRGKTVILYFYPKDDTPGCIIEAKEFSENSGNFQKLDAVVIGVSYDDLDSHRRFKQKYQIPFHLIVDSDKKISQAYGTDGVFFASRQTFVINPEGKVQKIYYNVNPSGHASKILKDLSQAETQPTQKK